MEMLEFLHGTLKASNFSVEPRAPGPRLRLNGVVGGNFRSMLVEYDGCAKIYLFFYLQTLDSFPGRELALLRSAVEVAHADKKFGGDLSSHQGALWWRLQTHLASNEEAIREVLGGLFTYAQEDLFRLDIIRGLASAGRSVETIRDSVNRFGVVEGLA